MELQEALLARLTAAAGVTAIVGSGDAARIHWKVRPQGGTLPALVLQVVSQDQPQHLDGYEDMKTARVQVDCLSTSNRVAHALAAAVQEALAPAATVVDPSGADLLFWQAGVEGPRDLGDQPATGAFIHNAEVDLIIRHGKAA